MPLFNLQGNIQQSQNMQESRIMRDREKISKLELSIQEYKPASERHATEGETQDLQ